jgi:hypothetical protein
VTQLLKVPELSLVVLIGDGEAHRRSVVSSGASRVAEQHDAPVSLAHARAAQEMFELLDEEQRVLFIEIVEQAQKTAQSQANPEAETDRNVSGSEAANMAAAIANGQNAKKN